MSKRPTLAIFASDKGHGDASRTSIMSQAGSFLAKKGVRLIYVTRAEEFSLPLVKSARAAGGEVTVVSNAPLNLPASASSVEVQTFADASIRRQYVIAEVDGFLALPGSLASVADLYETWMAADGNRPTALLNHNRAYELMRGIGVDIFAHTVPSWEQNLIIAETIEDLWAKFARVLGVR